MNKKTNDILTAAMLGLGSAVAIGTFIGNTIYDSTINRKHKTLFKHSFLKEDNLISGQFKRTDAFRDAIAWAEKTPITEMDIAAVDEIYLHAYCFEQSRKTDKWVIAFHDYSQGSASMFTTAMQFYQKGYNVVLPETRGTGKSGGKCYGMGWKDRLDVISWIDHILKVCPEAQIVLYGISTGADAVLMASGEELPASVKCIIEDSAYSVLMDVFNLEIKRHGFPAFPANYATSIVTRIRAGFTLSEASAVKQVEESVTPILFIHGEKDEIFPPEMGSQLYNAAQCEKEMLMIPEASHMYGMYADWDLYWNKVWEFTEKHISESINIPNHFLNRFTKNAK